MWCVIPAAGAGSRMDAGAVEPGDEERPKPLLRVGGETLLGRILRDVSEVARAACIVVAPDDRRIRRALGRRVHGLPLRYAVQEERRGVGDAVCAAAPVVDGPFALVMADGYFGEPLAPYLARWRDGPHPGGALVRPLDAPPETLEEPAGLVRVRDGTVREAAKGTDPAGFTHRLCGVTMLPDGALELCSRLEPSAATGEIEGEALVRALLDRGVAFGAFSYGGWRRNVNTPADLREVRRRAAGG